MRISTLSRLPAIVLLAALFAGCGDDAGKNCLRSAGEVISENRFLSDFTEVDLGRRIELVLVQDNQNYAIVTTGGNIMNGLITRVDTKGRLRIENKNICNWSRSYQTPFKVELHCKNLKYLRNEGTGKISCLNTLTADTLVVEMWTSASDVALQVNNMYTAIIQHMSPNDVELSGQTQKLYSYTNDLATLRADSLKADMVEVDSRSLREVRVWVGSFLHCFIGASGNVYYSGPGEISSLSIEGSGNLIRVN